MPDLCLINSDDPLVTIITLNRPEKRNALSVDLIERLTDAARKAEDDTACRVVIFNGAGPSFCAGLDLHEAASTAGAARSAEALAELYRTVARLPMLTIAAARGAVMGGGVGLLSGCDLALAAEDLRIGFPEVHRGLVAALVTVLVRRQLSDRVVRELVLLGETVDAHRALRLGLVSQVAPADQLHPASLALAKRACQSAPGAVARTKQLLDDLAARPLEQDLQTALASHLSARTSDEAREGIAAFIEKRDPRWPPRPTPGL